MLVLRLVYGFLIRASYALHGIYEQERWELTPRSSGYLSSYKQALGLLLNTLLIGRLAAKLPAPQLLQLALLASALNSAVEYASSLFTSPFALYVGLNLPISAVCGALTRTLLSALFAEAVPTRDAGAPRSRTLAPRAGRLRTRAVEPTPGPPTRAWSLTRAAHALPRVQARPSRSSTCSRRPSGCSRRSTTASSWAGSASPSSRWSHASTTLSSSPWRALLLPSPLRSSRSASKGSWARAVRVSPWVTACLTSSVGYCTV